MISEEIDKEMEPDNFGIQWERDATKHQPPIPQTVQINICSYPRYLILAPCQYYRWLLIIIIMLIFPYADIATD